MRIVVFSIFILAIFSCKTDVKTTENYTAWDLKDITKEAPEKLEFKQKEFTIIVESKKVEGLECYFMTITNEETNTGTGVIELDYFPMGEGSSYEVLSFKDFNFDEKKELMIVDSYGGMKAPGFWIYDSETLKPMNLFVMDKNVDYFFIKDGNNLDVIPNKTIETNYFKGFYDLDKKTKTLNAVCYYDAFCSITENYKYDAKTGKFNIENILTTELPRERY